MNERGKSPIIIVITIMVTIIGLIAIYTTLAPPLDEFITEIKGRMDAHTGPIDNFWLIFRASGLFAVVSLVLWAIIASQEEEYERERIPRRP